MVVFCKPYQLVHSVGDQCSLSDLCLMPLLLLFDLGILSVMWSPAIKHVGGLVNTKWFYVFNCQQAQTHTVVVIALFVVMLMFYLHTVKGFLQRAAVIICSCSSAAYISTHTHRHTHAHIFFFFFNVWKKVRGCLYIHLWLGASCMQINCSSLFLYS